MTIPPSSLDPSSPTLLKNSPTGQPHNLLVENATNKGYRSIQTFMKRKTHMGKKAELGLGQAYQDYLVQKDLARIQAMDITGIDNLYALFDTVDAKAATIPLTVEIGFGMGTSLVSMAAASPDRYFVGIEVHEAGIGQCAFLAKEAGLSNLKLISGDALALFAQLPSDHIDTLQLFFPDPWQKKRHHKRRFVTPHRMAIVQRVIKSGGLFHAATDWEHYAHHMIEVLDSLPAWQNVAGYVTEEGQKTKGQFLPRPATRPLTKFEQRGIDEGRAIFDILYQKCTS